MITIKAMPKPPYKSISARDGLRLLLVSFCFLWFIAYIITCIEETPEEKSRGLYSSAKSLLVELSYLILDKCRKGSLPEFVWVI